MDRFGLALLLLTLAATAAAADFTATSEKISAAMASSIRASEDVARQTGNIINAFGG